MQLLPDFHNHILKINSNNNFNAQALNLFNFQYENNKVYRQYCDLINIKAKTVDAIEKIPFLPISFFKTHEIVTGNFIPEAVFTSSGTTGIQTSRHAVKSLSTYEASFNAAFEMFYQSPDEYVVIGLLPSYLEREGSSLVYMVDHLIKQSGHPQSGFYLNNLGELSRFLNTYKGDKKIFLIGVSYALLDLADQYKVDLSKCIVMETGGMKGKRKEMTKSELHDYLMSNLKVNTIHSEYGMTELLSQAYALNNGDFKCPPWMKILIREYNDPFSYTKNRTGGINIIDLANIHSCAFIATQDLGRIEGEYFKVLGRFDNSDLRGCNLLIQ